MRYQDLRAALEADLAWRQAELHALGNIVRNLERAEDRDRLRRALLLMLYAHLEGFTKTAFLSHIDAINEDRIRVREANPHVAACSLAGDFRDFRNPNKKSALFRNDLPDDSALHQHARERDLIETLGELFDKTVEISDKDAELVADTESNLKPVVLKKILYRLGLAPEQLEIHAGRLHELLQWRNKITHGEEKGGVDEGRYAKLSSSVSEVMNGVVEVLTIAAANQAHKRASAARPPIPMRPSTHQKF